jgi:hypothetical protein
MECSLTLAGCDPKLTFLAPQNVFLEGRQNKLPPVSSSSNDPMLAAALWRNGRR